MISKEYINEELRKYAASPAGRKAIKKKYGIDYEKARIDNKIIPYADDMKNILLSHITPIIRSIKGGDIIIGDPKFSEDGKATIVLSFDEESLRRESLYPEKYPEGLNDIVLLFTKGYTASNYVHGVWKNSSYSGEIVGRISRPPDDFLQKAVDEFNAKYPQVAIATLKEPYK